MWPTANCEVSFFIQTLKWWKLSPQYKTVPQLPPPIFPMNIKTNMTCRSHDMCFNSLILRLGCSEDTEVEHYFYVSFVSIPVPTGWTAKFHFRWGLDLSLHHTTRNYLFISNGCWFFLRRYKTIRAVHIYRLAIHFHNSIQVKNTRYFIAVPPVSSMAWWQRALWVQ